MEMKKLKENYFRIIFYCIMELGKMNYCDVKVNCLN